MDISGKAFVVTASSCADRGGGGGFLSSDTER